MPERAGAPVPSMIETSRTTRVARGAVAGGGACAATALESRRRSPGRSFFMRRRMLAAERQGQGRQVGRGSDRERRLSGFGGTYCASTARPTRNSRRTSRTRRDTTTTPAGVSPMSSRPACPFTRIAQKTGSRLPGLCFRRKAEALTRALAVSNPVGWSRDRKASRSGVVASTAGYARTRSSPSHVSKTQQTRPAGAPGVRDPEASGSTVRKLSKSLAAGQPHAAAVSQLSLLHCALPYASRNSILISWMRP